MRILQINTVCGISSTGRIAVDIAEELHKQGHSCKILYGVGDVPAKYASYACKISTPLGVKIASAKRKFFDAEGLSNRCSTYKAIAEIRNFAPDIIHLHNIHGCYLHYPTLFRFLKKYNRPIVWTMHDCWLFTGHCAYFDYANCNRWQSQCMHCPQSTKGYPPNLFLDRSKQNFACKKRYFTGLPITLVSPSRWLAKLSKQSFLHYPVRVIYNAVNAEVFKEKGTSTNAKKILLSVANDWDERKGLKYLLALHQRLNPAQYQVVVIGLSKAQCQSLPTGMVGIERTQNIEELVQYYQQADVFVNPTLEDNMPLVNLEALACGTPLVVFDTGGCPEICPKEVGEVVPKGDIEALQKAVEQVATQSKSYTPACIEYAKQFQKQNIYQQYIDLYQELQK